MTLASLRKRGPSVRRSPISVDEFINEAELYAIGGVIPLPHTKLNKLNGQGDFKRATFTLGDQAIAQLDELSQRTGIAKSRLIRIWIEKEHNMQNINHYLTSKLK